MKQPETAAALARMKDLAEVCRLVQSDICDQDTGWFYHFKSATEMAERALRALDNE